MMTGPRELLREGGSAGLLLAGRMEMAGEVCRVAARPDDQDDGPQRADPGVILIGRAR